METKKMIPYSLYLPEAQYKKLKDAAKNRQAAALVRNAIAVMLDGNDAFKTGYNKAVQDAAKIIYDNPEAQMIAVRGKDLGSLLTEQIESLEMQ